jgi:hypothetical protein
MQMVFLYGPPAVGKLTVAREVAGRTGFKLFDNHTSIDWALRFFDFGQEPFWRLVHSFRDAVFQECAREGLDLVSTFVYAQPADLELIERRFAIVEQHGRRVCLVQLTCDRDTLLARVKSAERAERGKLSTVDGLLAVMERHDILSAIPGRESLRIDNSHLSPGEVAERIVAHFSLKSARRATRHWWRSLRRRLLTDPAKLDRPPRLGRMY